MPAACALALLTWLSSALSAQVTGGPPLAAADTTASRETGSWGGVSVVPDFGTTVVSITVAVPVGSASDPPGRSGAAWLTGEVVRRVALNRLPGPARPTTELQVSVEQTRTVYRLVTLPSHGWGALDALETALFSAPLPAALFEEARVGLQEVFAFESAAPQRTFELEFRRLVASFDDPWSLDPRGTPATVDSLEWQELRSFRRSRYDPSRSVAVIVGPVTLVEGGERLTGAELPSEGYAVSPALAGDSTASTPPWSRGERVVLIRPVTSTWIGVAFPVEAAVSHTSLDLLLHRMNEELNPDPPLPGTFSVTLDLARYRGSDLLLVEAAVLPDVADEWEQRILATVEEIASERLEPSFFAWHRRHFRSTQLLRESAPEERGLRVAGDLLWSGHVRNLPEEIRTLDAEDMRGAAAGLGEPRILVLGPDLSAFGGS